MDCIPFCNRGCNKLSSLITIKLEKKWLDILDQKLELHVNSVKQSSEQIKFCLRKTILFGEAIFGADKVLSKKNYPPGQHGNNRRKKTSEYGVMLAEKQKAKYTYGVLEKQFRNLFEKAASANGITGEILLQSLECRLDNVVFRLGIAPTRAAARQLVGHKHITVDGKVVNIPSYSVKPGQLVGVRERSKSLEVIGNALAGFNHSKYPWLEWDENSKTGKMLHIPERADIPENIKEHLIVELYSK